MFGLRSTRSFVYTLPLGEADARAVEEIEEIDDLGPAATAADLARRVELAAGLGPVNEVRFTLGTITAYQLGRYDAYRRQLGDWLTEKLGQDADTETAEGSQLFTQGLRWARARAALLKVEQRTIDYQGPDAVTWAEVEIPAGWDTPDGFLGEVPAGVVAKLARTANAVNPNLFTVPTNEEAKKKGGISDG